jgi:hypothetical protein
VKKHPSTASPTRYPNINILCSEDFSLAKDGEQGWLSRLHARYKKVGKYVKVLV